MSRTPKSGTTKLPLTEKRLAANRANAARSTGPKTPEGKARSARNALQHGFTASSFAVIRLEEFSEIERLKADLVSVYQPVNSQEMVALERMALAQQSMFRASRLEAGLFASGMNDFCDGRSGNLTFQMNAQFVGDGDITITQQQNRNHALAEGFQQQVSRSHVWTLFLRYHAQSERMYRRALEEFNRLKSLRDELPNEPTSALQPQPPEQLPPTAEAREASPQTRERSERPSPTPASEASNSQLKPTPVAMPLPASAKLRISG